MLYLFQGIVYIWVTALAGDVYSLVWKSIPTNTSNCIDAIVIFFVSFSFNCYFFSIRELIKVLKEKDKKVFLVSGGFHDIIAPVANELGIPQENIYANRLLFNEGKLKCVFFVFVPFPSRIN